MAGASILVYAERLGGSLSHIEKLLANELSDFSGVHVLPFFHPFDGDDAGFDPIDHTIVDPRLGSWEDFRRISATHELTADLIINHASNLSPEFLDWQEKGDSSEFAGMFLTFDKVFPTGGTEETITSFYRPRPGLPFTAYNIAGTRRLVWTSFMPSQVDIDVRHPGGEAYIDRVLDALESGGVKVVRLDAVGYAIKTPGTDSFMTKETLEYVSELTAKIQARGMRVLVEVHAHYTQQLEIAPLVDLIYDFQTAPLLLHSIFNSNVDALASWLEIRPKNCLNVLDTHDGYGVIDAGPIGGKSGLISQDDMKKIFEVASRNTSGHSDKASVVPQWFDLPHQINATLPAIINDDNSYILARAVQFMLPGEPQVYYVGLLNGQDDKELFDQTGNGREVNRHNYSAEEIETAIKSDVTQAILGLARLRQHEVFGGSFEWQKVSESSMRLAWRASSSQLTLEFALAEGKSSFCLTLAADGSERTFESAKELAAF